MMPVILRTIDGKEIIYPPLEKLSDMMPIYNHHGAIIHFYHLTDSGKRKYYVTGETLDWEDVQCVMDKSVLKAEF